MKGIFWNSRGLRDLAKFRFLSETTKEQQLDFIALLETCRANYTDMDSVNTRSCLQILFRATHWIRFWALLQKQEERETIP
jgi:hypothetical protein